MARNRKTAFDDDFPAMDADFDDDDLDDFDDFDDFDGFEPSDRPLRVRGAGADGNRRTPADGRRGSAGLRSLPHDWADFDYGNGYASDTDWR